eukprot:TRINITY_DN9014_c0_g2_i1.p1 TRINITY_DN9014_c0_g2~~TRINITY_DN9014_c0_g2_i1.p1  ORF type:complete len:859 (+),score=215.67 TRINITY_DN9014_c0_g2_i1:63-2639(+)
MTSVSSRRGSVRPAAGEGEGRGELLLVTEELRRERIQCRAFAVAGELAALCHSNAVIMTRSETLGQGRACATELWELRRVAAAAAHDVDGVEFGDADGDAVRLTASPTGELSLKVNNIDRGRLTKAMNWDPEKRMLRCRPWRLSLSLTPADTLPVLLERIASLCDRCGVKHDLPRAAVAAPPAPPAVPSISVLPPPPPGPPKELIEELTSLRAQVRQTRLQEAAEAELGERLRRAAGSVGTRAEGTDGARREQDAALYSGTQGDASSVADQMGRFARRLEQWYDAKEGDVVDELCANLRFPGGSEPLVQLAAVAHALRDDPRVAGAFGDLCLAELLVLRGYTQKPLDIDRDVGWPDVPPPLSAVDPPGASEARARYERTYTDWGWAAERDGVKMRNGSLFSAVCSSVRDQGPGGARGDWSEKTLRRWIKWACTLGAVTSQDSAPQPAPLWRGLGGGGLPGAVVEAHRQLCEGDVLGWPAPSSTSHDARASAEYMWGEAANSTSKPNSDRPGTIMFRMDGIACGRELVDISQYPAEAELLLSELTLFRVDSLREDPKNPFRNAHGRPMGLSVLMTCLGPLGAPLQRTPWLANFYARVRRDAEEASRRLLRRVAGAGPQPRGDALCRALEEAAQCKRLLAEAQRRAAAEQAAARLRSARAVCQRRARATQTDPDAERSELHEELDATRRRADHATRRLQELVAAGEEPDYCSSDLVRAEREAAALRAALEAPREEIPVQAAAAELSWALPPELLQWPLRGGAGSPSCASHGRRRRPGCAPQHQPAPDRGKGAQRQPPASRGRRPRRRSEAADSEAAAAALAAAARLSPPPPDELPGGAADPARRRPSPLVSPPRAAPFVT